MSLLSACCLHEYIVHFVRTAAQIKSERMRFRTHPDREQEMIFYSKVCSGSADFKFLGVHISEDLRWSLNTAHIIKKAQ